MKTKRFQPHTSTLYHRFPTLYDWFFARIVGARIRSTIESLEIGPGAKVLEVGVGTGSSLPAYPDHAEVIGIDIAPEMLARAQESIQRHGWRHVVLRKMDALHLEFDDDQFDYVTAFHIASVVADSDCFVRELLRVTKPGGKIAVINHFRSRRKWIASLVDMLDPVARHFGWRTTLRLNDLVSHGRMRIERCFKTSSFSLFTILVATKLTSQPLASSQGHLSAPAPKSHISHGQSHGTTSGDTDTQRLEGSSSTPSRSLRHEKTTGATRS